jgi:3-oxoadipate enol-lactonase
MPVIRVNGIEIYHEVHGSDDSPWVLNIGGTGGDLRQTLPAYSPLNKAFRVLHYDQRGLGQTSKPEGDYTMGQYADDAAALIDSVMGEPCHVVGTSFGGMVAMHLALRRPELIKRLAMLVTSPGGEHASYRLTDLEQLDPDEAFAIRMRLYDQRWDPEADEPIPNLGGVYDFLVAQRDDVPTPDVAAGLARQLEARNGHDVVDRLGSITHPTFVGCGRYDGMAPVANSEVLVDGLPNARLEVFDGGHLLGFQDRTLWPTVVDFLRDPESGAV